MPTKNPRVMTVLDLPLYEWVKKTAQSDGISVSLRLRDIVRQAYELSEDAYWTKIGEDRLASFNKEEALTHTQVWEK